ncbi:3-phosphoshikimate 1-carboxyvinyltransferase [Galdieria sulphuraria]|uniref:3-phosphoshikimate 1-carboxyvinyltransferase n=1 Tax=Galdieria sulphuraria TaxID=130081 RepID=M2Y907_GALSU|nr:3-phosphoshikimate 1-carboxyvinyltransferase [Galdieria sulphuraria]EME32324.1 3-phosphoshikimate 1-carboxyvinyltransferase [Galdieria sulphuraria]|eukprot:XP_005708844.1 3-phosphoshikimate 1-carboxyvinyltransferase [Galdieria sulphuraria]
MKEHGFGFVTLIPPKLTAPFSVRRTLHCLTVRRNVRQFHSRKGFLITLVSQQSPECTYLKIGGIETVTVPEINNLTGTLVLPGSKSLSNRVLLLSALAKGTTLVENLLESEDVSYMLEALKLLGVKVEYESKEKKARIEGCGGPFPASTGELFLGNAGTAMRPLTAALCLGDGEFVLDGVKRMRERPIADLVQGLQQLGAQVTCSDTGCPPVHIKAKGLRGGKTIVSGKMSSQFLSSLLMAAPYSKNDVVIEIQDELISVPYVSMTIELMRRFGVTVGNEDYRVFRIAGNQCYSSPGSYFVEGDASSASYFLAGGAITGGPITVEGCGSDSIQGDIRFVHVLEKMGATVSWTPHSITVSRGKGKVLEGIDEDCIDIPDAAMTLAVVALFAEGHTALRNIYSWRVKETDRLAAMSKELMKLGAAVMEGQDYIVIYPPGGGKIRKNVTVSTYNDHRMAMSLSLAACGGCPITIEDPKCTWKTFPSYFEELTRLIR